MYKHGHFRGEVSDMRPLNIGTPMCDSELKSWCCTRPDGHDGLHRAGTVDGVWVAEWDDDRSTDSVDEWRDFFEELGL